MTTTTLALTTCDEIAAYVRSRKQSQQTIGVVNTMGALHAGHISLVEKSVSQNDVTIATIFVNPTQFAPDEDLSRYPRPLEQDLDQLAVAGVDCVFAPGEREMYPEGFSTFVQPPAVAEKLEGEFRPTHFVGVTTVVLKLLNLTSPDVAYFGQKDYQQSLVIRHMVRDLNLPVRIEVCPTVRQPDGLALSSRNAYLTADQRQQALAIKQTLDFVRAEVEAGQTDGYELVTEMRQRLIDGGITRIDYAVIADPETLQTRDHIVSPSVALIAAYVGQTRLIDNCLISS